jgi:hypothetical protein
VKGIQLKSLTLLLVLLIYFSCTQRKDEIFFATDELHGIHLFDRGQEFEILYNGVNTAKGTYSISGDTIFLTYDEDENNLSGDKNSASRHANDVLTRALLIEYKTNRINSIDNRMKFCADIYLDKRKMKK